MHCGNPTTRTRPPWRVVEAGPERADERILYAPVSRRVARHYLGVEGVDGVTLFRDHPPQACGSTTGILDDGEPQGVTTTILEDGEPQGGDNEHFGRWRSVPTKFDGMIASTSTPSPKQGRDNGPQTLFSNMCSKPKENAMF